VVERRYHRPRRTPCPSVLEWDEQSRSSQGHVYANLEPVQFSVVVWFGQAGKHEIVGILEERLGVAVVHLVVVEC
jgi:hypothetical protein